MKLLKKISIVYSLQIIAVFILFFYPDYSSMSRQKEMRAGKTFIPNKKNTDRDVNMNTIRNVGDTMILPNYREPEK